MSGPLPLQTSGPGAVTAESAQLVDAPTAADALPGSAGTSEPTEAQEAIDDFTREWARRVAALEASAARYLRTYGLEDRIGLVRTDVSIELRMPDHILFPSGSAGLQLSGHSLVSELSGFLKSVEGHIHISGHTDNVPIRADRFPSNWELSASGAIAVVTLLRDVGVPGERLQAVGHGASRPVAPNDEAIGRAANRRVTIDITPLPG